MRDALERLRDGALTVDAAMAEIRRQELVELDGRARLDLGRSARRGLPEVVLAAGKTPDDAARLVTSLALAQGQGLVSRMSADHLAAVSAAALEHGLECVMHGDSARLVKPGFLPTATQGRSAVITAGTSDGPVAEEARMVLDACGVDCRMVSDVGVAGLHRLMKPLSELLEWDPDVLIVAAGMDGVLPGVIAGLVDVPVIALPVATGYGLGGRGEAALMTMLQSCSTGLTVVNIDNGIGAGTAAALIAIRAGAARRSSPGAALQSPKAR